MPLEQDAYSALFTLHIANAGEPVAEGGGGLAASPDRPRSNQDVLHLGGPAVSERLFGDRSKKNVRRVHALLELPAEKRPDFIEKIGSQPAAWESRIRTHATRSRG